ncbi:hypothetical protein QUB40_05430 [Microcoleus sp. AT9_A2]
MPDSTGRSDDFEATGRSDGCTRTRTAGMVARVQNAVSSALYRVLGDWMA